MINIEYSDNIDGFFLCYKNPKATLYVIKKFFTHYPNSNIYLHSDNGCNYRLLKKQYSNIIYYHHHIQCNPFKMTADRSKEWAKRLYKSINKSTKKYFILLEDDVWINSRVNIYNRHNMVGTNLRAYFNSYVYSNIKKYPKLQHMSGRWSGCGGCIFEADIIRNQKLIDIYNMIEYVSKYIRLAGDQLLTLMIYLGRGTLGVDKYYSTNLNSDISHGKICKYYYNQPLNKDENKMITCLNNSKDPVNIIFDIDN